MNKRILLAASVAALMGLGVAGPVQAEDVGASVTVTVLRQTPQTVEVWQPTPFTTACQNAGAGMPGVVQVDEAVCYP